MQHVGGAPGGFLEHLVDMTAALARVRALREAGIAAEYRHLVVHAAAVALSRHADLHMSVLGYHRYYPGRVDIGVALPGLAFPVVVEGVEQKTLKELVPAMDDAVARGPRALASRSPLLGWIGRVVRLVLSLMAWFRSAWVRRATGTFQVHFAPTADMVVPFRFAQGSALGAGRVREAVVARDERIEVRPVMTLTLAVDHVAFDGMRAATLMHEIAAVLEGRDEIPGA
jgi:pyruvate/2-oxoglutarate dehydrogenase complex dihydrolipoamide acyltransferase (E2) component